MRFREGKPEDGESPEQFVTRLNRYLTRWVELSKTEKTYEGISDLFIKEQFIHSCPEDLEIYFRQRNLENLEELTKTAEQFLVAHEKKLSSSSKPHNKLKVLSKGMNSPDSSKESTHEKRVQCFNCKGYGHKASECRKPARQEPRAEKRCFLCDHSGHYARDCKVAGSKNGPFKAGAAQHGSSAFSGVGPELESCIQNNELLLANGTKLPIVKSGGSVTESLGKNKMPVVKGLVGNTAVDTLRDTGCSGVVVRKQFVKEDQYTGKYCYILLNDNTVRQVPDS